MGHSQQEVGLGLGGLPEGVEPEFSSWISRWRAWSSRVRSVWLASKSRSRPATSLGELLGQAGRVVDQAVAPFHLATAARTWVTARCCDLLDGHDRRGGARPRAGRTRGLPLFRIGIGVM